MIISSMFGFNWERFAKPTVIAGLVVMVVGMIFLACGGAMARAVNKSRLAAGKTPKDTSLIFKGIAAVFVVAGALLAVFTA